MKKNLLAVLFCTAALANAQEQSKTLNFKYGVTANLHQSNIRGIHSWSKGRIAPGLGAFAQFPLDARVDRGLYLMPQIEFSMEGERAEDPRGEQKFYYNYINIPVYFKYYFSISKKSELQEDNFFVQAGPNRFTIIEKVTPILLLQNIVLIYICNGVENLILFQNF